MKKHIIILTLMTVLFCTPAISKTFSTNRVDSKEDWSVFMENNPSQCWIVSAPSRTKATRNGKSVKISDMFTGLAAFGLATFLRD